MRRLVVGLRERSYPIIVGAGAIQRLPDLLRQRQADLVELCVVTTAVVHRLHGATLQRLLQRGGYRCRIVEVPDTESSKSVPIYLRLLTSLARSGRGGQPILIAMGGGVIGDLVGFTAATFKRGVPYLQVPTTLLAQVDSAIGGKTALDLPTGKNLVGAFYQPIGVISEIRFLNTLPVRQLRSGLAEVVKYGVLGDEALFRYVEHEVNALLSMEPRALTHVVIRCAEAKARFVARDEYDRHEIRMRLNLGHTVGHALEAATGYARRLSHGEAVSIGMVAAARLARRLGICHEAVERRLVTLLTRIGLPVAYPGVRPDRILNAMRHDKKFTAGSNRFVLPTRIGQVVIARGVSYRLIREVVGELAQTKPT